MALEFFKDTEEIDLIALMGSGLKYTHLVKHSLEKLGVKCNVLEYYPISLESERDLSIDAIPCRSKHNLIKKRGVNCSLEEFANNPDIRVIGDVNPNNIGLILDDCYFDAITLKESFKVFGKYFGYNNLFSMTDLNNKGFERLDDSEIKALETIPGHSYRLPAPGALTSIVLKESIHYLDKDDNGRFYEIPRMKRRMKRAMGFLVEDAFKELEAEIVDGKREYEISKFTCTLPYNPKFDPVLDKKDWSPEKYQEIENN